MGGTCGISHAQPWVRPSYLPKYHPVSVNGKSPSGLSSFVSISLESRETVNSFSITRLLVLKASSTMDANNPSLFLPSDETIYCNKQQAQKRERKLRRRKKTLMIPPQENAMMEMAIHSRNGWNFPEMNKCTSVSEGASCASSVWTNRSPLQRVLKRDCSLRRVATTLF